MAASHGGFPLLSLPAARFRIAPAERPQGPECTRRGFQPRLGRFQAKRRTQSFSRRGLVLRRDGPFLRRLVLFLVVLFHAEFGYLLQARHDQIVPRCLQGSVLLVPPPTGCPTPAAPAPCPPRAPRRRWNCLARTACNTRSSSIRVVTLARGMIPVRRSAAVAEAEEALDLFSLTPPTACTRRTG